MDISPERRRFQAEEKLVTSMNTRHWAIMGRNHVSDIQFITIRLDLEILHYITLTSANKQAPRSDLSIERYQVATSVFPDMIPAKPPFPPSGHYLSAIRQSSRQLRLNSNIKVCYLYNFDSAAVITCYKRIWHPN